MLNNHVLKCEAHLSLSFQHHTLCRITSHICTLCNRQSVLG